MVWPGNGGVSAGGRYEGEGMGAERALGRCSSFTEPMEMMMASWPGADLLQNVCASQRDARWMLAGVYVRRVLAACWPAVPG